nr:DUF123 domain-containing protein [Natrinema sp. DC36]
MLGNSATRLETAITFPGADRECELAGPLPGTPVPDFGASDCDCGSHLLEVSVDDSVLEVAADAGGIVDS